MQKVPMYPEPSTEAEKVTYIVNGLKDIALTEQVAMISIVAADKRASRRSGCGTTTSAARRRSTTRPTSS